ncbi:MAG: putative photosynthetic complex assembly protein PuhE [Pseudomonadota bacterium]
MSALAVFYALAVWWSITQAILWLVRLSPKPALNAAALVLAALSSVLAVLASREAGVHAAFVGFTAGIGLWAAFEITFLTGAILGVDTPARSQSLGARAWAALKAIIWHEGAVLATLILLVAATGGDPNPAAAATFAALWLMRASAKLNLFLGVQNHCAEFLPPPVAHLARHFRRANMNPMFPFSIFFGSLAVAVLLRAGFDPATSPHDATASMLIATLIGLGVLEHWLMVTPLSPLALWSGKLGASPSRSLLAGSANLSN